MKKKRPCYGITPNSDCKIFVEFLNSVADPDRFSETPTFNRLVNLAIKAYVKNTYSREEFEKFVKLKRSKDTSDTESHAKESA